MMLATGGEKQERIAVDVVVSVRFLVEQGENPILQTRIEAGIAGSLLRLEPILKNKSITY